MSRGSGYPGVGFAFHRRSSTGLLWVAGLYGKDYESIFVFDRATQRARRVLGFRKKFDTASLALGYVYEVTPSSSVGFVPRRDGPTDVYVRRKLVFDADREAFVPGRWHETITNPPASCTLHLRAGGHTAFVHMAKRNFRLGKRHVTFANGCPVLDGLKTLGTDAMSPDEIAKSTRNGHRDLFICDFVTFEVRLDGRRIPVPPRLWRDCMDPNFPPKATLRRDGRIRITLDGSDGAGSYEVIWTYSAGRWRRTFGEVA